jgi:hypothetical protein
MGQHTATHDVRLCAAWYLQRDRDLVTFRPGAGGPERAELAASYEMETTTKF